MQEADLQNSTLATGGFFVIFSGPEKTAKVAAKRQTFH